MDRLYYLNTEVAVGEILSTCKGICIYDGDTKTDFSAETAHLTSSLVYFASSKHPTSKLVLDMQYIVLLEEEGGGMLKHKKLVIHLSPFQGTYGNYQKVVARSQFSHIKLAFTDGGCSQFKSSLEKALSAFNQTSQSVKNQLPTINQKTSPPARSGIVGIERRMQEKMENTASNINLAFQDLTNLMDKAKDMVHLANAMSLKIKDRQGEISEDDTIKFKSYLLSLGIDDPVTRDAYSSSDTYRRKLANQIADYLSAPISQLGGIMALSDAYCRVNRARGFDLLSPEDFLKACQLLKDLKSSIVLRCFESGVYVLQLHTESNTEFDKDTIKLLKEREKLSPFELSQILGISMLLATERLLAAERAGLACRDDTVRGIVFYQNLFV